MRMDGRSDYQWAGAYLLSFMHFLVMMAVTVGLLLRTTVMDEEFVMDKVSHSQYAALLTEQIQKQIVNWGAVSGVEDETVFTDVVTEERVAEDTLKYFRGAMEGLNNLDTSDLEKELRDSIGSYAKSGDTSEVSEEELQENINHLVQLCVDGYRQKVAVGMLPKIGGIIHQFRHPADIGLYAGLAAILLLTGGIFLVTHYVKRGLRFLIYSLSASALAWWAFLIWTWASGVISRVALTSRPLYTLARDVMNAMYARACIAALAVTVLLALLVGIRVVLRRREIEKK